MAPDDETALDADAGVSPKNKTPMDEVIRESLGTMSNSLNSLDLRADPDAQATVTDFLDFTEYLPADMMRSLTLVGKLNQTYNIASSNVHDLTATWGKLPSIAAEVRPVPAQLRADISENLNRAVSARVYAHAEATRMAENVSRHYNRAMTILTKLQIMLENYPTAEEQQKSPVAASKSPQLIRAPKVTLRVGEGGQKHRRQRIPRITVPGEVLAPYEFDYDAYSDDSDISSSDDESDILPSRTTPAPRIKLVKNSRSQKTQKTPKSSSRTGRTYAIPAHAAAGGGWAVSPAALIPPPENAVPGSADAPWLQLTPYEMAKLRKRMKKNAVWTPSDTMIARELKALGRGVEAYRMAKRKAEEEGKPFENSVPALIVDAESGVQLPPEGAINVDALGTDDVPLSNKGMKLNEAKKLKREALAKLAAEEAEESARKMAELARKFMTEPSSSRSGNVPPDGAKENPKTSSGAKTKSKAKPSPNSNNHDNSGISSNNNNNTTNSVSNANSANNSGTKRKRDSITEADAERPELGDTPSARAQAKRTKTETPVPVPIPQHTPSVTLNSQPLQETPIPLPQLTPSAPTPTPQSTTPVPIPLSLQDASIAAAAKRASASPSGQIPTPVLANTVTTSVPTKPPAETPVPIPVLSPRKSTTPILPPVTGNVKRETRQDIAKKAGTPVPVAQNGTTPKPSTSRAGTPRTTPGPEGIPNRRPGSRGKAMSQEPQPSLAVDRPRRASTARNTPAPEARQVSKRTKRPAPGVVSTTNSGGNSAVGKRKAAPKRTARKKDKGQPEPEMEEVDDEGNPIDADEARYCLCNRVSFGTMIQCDNVDVSFNVFRARSLDIPRIMRLINSQNCKQEWFHLECVELSEIPARTTKWYCPECRVLLNIGEKGEVSARGVRM
jgi:hypothetical protein